MPRRIKFGAAFCKGGAKSHVLITARRKWPQTHYDILIRHYVWRHGPHGAVKSVQAKWEATGAPVDGTGRCIVAVLKRTHSVAGYYRRKYGSSTSGSGETGEVDVTVTDPTTTTVVAAATGTAGLTP